MLAGVNWEALGALAELTAAAGVIASLIYLASQIRQSSRHIEASLYQSANDAFIHWYTQLAGNPELASIWYEQVIPGVIDDTRRPQTDGSACSRSAVSAAT